MLLYNKTQCCSGCWAWANSNKCAVESRTCFRYDKRRMMRIRITNQYAVYSSPYVIMYGGSQDISNSSSTIGSNDVWVWDSRNGSWYKPTIQVQGGVSMLPQIYFKATTLPSQGQVVALVSNTTGGSATGVLQKLDINSWSWSFPTSSRWKKTLILLHILYTN